MTCSIIHVAVAPEFVAALDRHRANRADRPSRAAVLRDYTLRMVESLERERLDFERAQRLERARLARLDATTRRRHEEAANAERARKRAEARAAERAERAAAPRWSDPAP